MNNQIEQHGGIIAYFLENIRSSVISRTVGGEPNDGNVTLNEVASCIF